MTEIFARDQDADKEVNCPKLADNGPAVGRSVTSFAFQCLFFPLSVLQALLVSSRVGCTTVTPSLYFLFSCVTQWVTLEKLFTQTNRTICFLGQIDLKL